MSRSNATTFVFEYLSKALEYPPPPKVQSRKIPPVDGEEYFMISLNITGKCEYSSDDF